MLNNLIFRLDPVFKCAKIFEIPPKCQVDFERIAQILLRLPTLCMEWILENIDPEGNLGKLEELFKCITGGIMIALS